METVMRLVMCNWTWSHFAWEYLDSTRLDFTWKSRQTSRTLIFILFYFFCQTGSKGWGTLLGVAFSQMATCPLKLHPSLMSSKTTIYPRPPNPYAAFSQLAPPSPGPFCPLELSLCEKKKKKDKNTTRREFMVSADLPLKIWTFQTFSQKPK